LADIRVLELGYAFLPVESASFYNGVSSAGTGLLSIVLSPLVRHYTVTDIPALLPLIRKNVTLNFPSWPTNSNISLEELDWHHLHTTPHSKRSRLFSAFSSKPIDLILLVDCIYHPSLLPPLLSTIDYLAIPGKTAVLVVVELRAEDVIREWIAMWTGCEGWEVWRVGGDGWLKMPYVAWVGWKS
jgi:protein N-lysine methyltransferase METTL21D